jgi:double-stranded uracil-DNA glycosylase
MPRSPKPPTPPNLPLLKDRIRPGVRVLFVGINPGVRSALTGHHFAGYSNRFWKLLNESGLAPEPITYVDDDRLPDWGFGITNLVARPTRGIDELTPVEYHAGRAELERKIRRFAPKVVALVGVTLARALLRETPRLVGTRGVRPTRATPPPHAETERRDPASALDLGLQPETLAGAPVFVLPNPSGRNAHYSYGKMLDAFRDLKRYVGDRASAAGRGA